MEKEMEGTYNYVGTVARELESNIEESTCNKTTAACKQSSCLYQYSEKCDCTLGGGGEQILTLRHSCDGRLNLVLVKANARALLSRLLMPDHAIRSISSTTHWNKFWS